MTTPELRGRDSDGYLNDCPDCGFPVYEDGKFGQMPVLWEGRIVHGHLGCLAELQHARAVDSPDDAA